MIQGELQEITGEIVEVKGLGSTNEDSELFSLLGSEEDTFVIMQGESRLTISLGELPKTEGSGSRQAVQLALLQMLINIDEVYEVVAFYFNDKVSYVFIPKDGSAPTGTLVAFSRQFNFVNNQAPSYESGCSDWIPLSLNILRRPAEQIQICARTKCQAEAPKGCAITSINREVGLFATLVTSPNAPYDMEITNSTCTADVGYGITYLNFSVNALVMDLKVGMEMGGSLESQIGCDGSVTVKRRVGPN